MTKIHSKRRYVGLGFDTDCFGGFLLDYYILESTIKLPNSNFEAVIYGIEIEKKYEDDGGEKIVERAVVNDIYYSKENTQILIDKLAEKLVLPSTLKYVIHDILGERGLEPPEITVITA